VNSLEMAVSVLSGALRFAQLGSTFG
jgi:hypothetical protein